MESCFPALSATETGDRWCCDPVRTSKTCVGARGRDEHGTYLRMVLTFCAYLASEMYGTAREARQDGVGTVQRGQRGQRGNSTVRRHTRVLIRDSPLMLVQDRGRG